jgi:hypothetical protein
MTDLRRSILPCNKAREFARAQLLGAPEDLASFQVGTLVYWTGLVVKEIYGDLLEFLCGRWRPHQPGPVAPCAWRLPGSRSVTASGEGIRPAPIGGGLA